MGGFNRLDANKFILYLFFVEESNIVDIILYAFYGFSKYFQILQKQKASVQTVRGIELLGSGFKSFELLRPSPTGSVKENRPVFKPTHCIIACSFL